MKSTKPKATDTEQKFFIQQRAAAGNYYDSVGMFDGCARAEAEVKLAQWAKSFPEEKFRLVIKLTVPLIVC